MDISNKQATLISLQDLGANPTKYGFEDTSEALSALYAGYKRLHPMRMAVAIQATLIEYLGEFVCGTVTIASYVALASWLVDKASDGYEWLKTKVKALITIVNPSVGLTLGAVDAIAGAGKSPDVKQDADTLYDTSIEPAMNPQLLTGLISSALPIGIGATLFAGSVPSTRSRNTAAKNPGKAKATRPDRIKEITAAALEAIKAGESIGEAIANVVTKHDDDIIHDIDPERLMQTLGDYEIHPTDAAILGS